MSKKVWLKVVMPLAILLAGVAVTVVLVKSKEEPVREEKPVRGALVETYRVVRDDHQVKVFATGTVRPRRQVAIAAQVSGAVVTVSEKFVTGGFLDDGEVLFELDPIDFEIAVEQAQANVSRAELELETIEGRARVAREEWQRLNPADTVRPQPLVLYEPQLKSARAALRAARAAARQARVNLQRTIIAAPFPCYVKAEQIDLGQFVRAGVTVAEVVGTGQAEIEVPIPLEELAWLDIPRSNDAPGSRALIRAASDGREQVWNGYLTRRHGDIDQRDRMARVVVTVEDPYRLQPQAEPGPPLATGLFVNVELLGKTLKDVASIPPAAVRADNTVWLYEAPGKLRISPVEVLRRERQNAVIGTGVEAEDRIILTTLTGVADGMLVRMAGEQGE